MATMSGTKTMCTVCNLTLNSYDQYIAHTAGKAHKRKEELAGTSASASAQLPPAAVKIVRPNTFIKFVSSQGGDNPVSSQNVNNASDASGENKNESTQNMTNVVVSQQNGAFCHTCVVKLTSQAQADMHYSGSKHKRAVALAVSGNTEETKSGGVKRKLEEICEVCNVPLITKAVAEAHYAGAKHGKKLKLSQNISSATTGPPCNTFPGLPHPSQKVQPGNLFFCNYCKVTVNSQMQLDAHQQGAKHKSAISGVVQRKKIFKPRQPQEQNRFIKPIEQNRSYVKPQEMNRFQEQSRFVSPGHFQTGNYGNSTGPMPFRPGVPVGYPTPYY